MWKVFKMYWSSRSGLSVGLVFFTVSVLFGSWIARIPEVKARLAMSEAEMGLTLLGMPIGSLVGALLAGRQLRRVSLGQFTFSAAVVLCLVTILPALAPTKLLLGAALFCIGLASTATDIGMNAAAAQVEQRDHIVIMSACHGMFSLGGMVGAVLAGLTAGVGVPLWVHLGVLGLIMLVVNIRIRPVLLAVPSPRKHEQGFSLPPRALWGLALIGFCIMLGEGAVADWSAIFLREVRQSSAFTAAMGFAAFSLLMSIGRFAGDALTIQLGGRRLITLGSLLGSAGLVIAVAIPAAGAGVLGFALTGLGFSVVVPLLFSQAARLQPDAPGDGIAGIATSGIVGFMVGPPAIGFIAEGFGLPVGFLVVAILALLAALGSRRF